MRHRQGIELGLGFEVGGERIASRPMALGDQLRQPVIALRADHQIHRGLADHDFLALGLRDAAGDGDDHLVAFLGPARLDRLQPAEFRIDLFGRLLTDVAGVEHDHVRALGIVGQTIA